MTDYGYTINQITSNDEIPESKLEEFENYMSSKRHLREDMMTKETFKFLSHITDDNIDIYKKIMQGDYEIFRGDKYEEVREDNNLYVENIEILEKNTPIVLSLYKNFTLENIIEIYKHCVDAKTKKINFTKLNRIRRFVRLENQRNNKRLDFPVLRFLQDTKKWVDTNNKVTKDEIDTYLKNYACKYANSVKDVVVDDVNYLEQIYEFIKELFNVIVIVGRPSNGIFNIRMFELLWEKRDSTNWMDIYGDSNTKEFFAEELIEQLHTTSNNLDEEDAPELEHTAKVTRKDIEDEIPNIVHKEFDYYEYSKLDGSNNRFLRKQENTKNIFNSHEENLNTPIIITTEQTPDLFDLMSNEAPF
jgi:hypothetical protein